MKIAKDKVLHFSVNLIVCYVTAIIVYIPADLVCAANAGFFMAAGMSIGKEYGDSKAAGNHWCWWDILADYLGNICGLILFGVTIYLIKIWKI